MKMIYSIIDKILVRFEDVFFNKQFAWLLETDVFDFFLACSLFLKGKCNTWSSSREGKAANFNFLFYDSCIAILMTCDFKACWQYEKTMINGTSNITYRRYILVCFMSRHRYSNWDDFRFTIVHISHLCSNIQRMKN